MDKPCKGNVGLHTLQRMGCIVSSNQNRCSSCSFAIRNQIPIRCPLRRRYSCRCCTIRSSGHIHKISFTAVSDHCVYTFLFSSDLKRYIDACLRCFKSSDLSFVFSEEHRADAFLGLQIHVRVEAKVHCMEVVEKRRHFVRN